MATLAEQAVDAINRISGSHAGQRAAHAKGVVCAGTFTATPAAGALTRAPHMQGDTLRATVRFSNGSGNPAVPDGAPDGRGLAVKLYLPDGRRTDMVAVTLPCFFARTPEDFVEFEHALAPGGEGKGPRPRPLRLLRYLIRNPKALPAIRAARELRPVPSFANCRFNGLHAFKWTAADGSERHVRYSWAPEAGEATLDGAEARRRSPDYLREELAERFGRGEPVRFTLELQVAADGDPLDDPRVAWPAERERIAAGTLEVGAFDTERERDGDVLVFDPTRVIDGIECSADPILNFRPHAYDESVKRRSGISRDGAGAAS